MLVKNKPGVLVALLNVLFLSLIGVRNILYCCFKHFAYLNSSCTRSQADNEQPSHFRNPVGTRCINPWI